MLLTRDDTARPIPAHVSEFTKPKSGIAIAHGEWTNPSATRTDPTSDENSTPLLAAHSSSPMTTSRTVSGDASIASYVPWKRWRMNVPYVDSQLAVNSVADARMPGAMYAS